jgi:hypothetical protein
MSLHVDLPPDLENQLRAQSPNLDAEAREAMLVELYRQDKITRYQLSLGLGLTRFETDAVLKKHNVTEDQPTLEELEEDLRRGQSLVRK